MFDIKVEDPEAKKEGRSGHVHVWQNSWGFTTRSIGVMILTHGDDKGLVLPPRIAKIQVVVVPVGITAKTTDAQRAELEKGVEAIAEALKEAKVSSRSPALAFRPVRLANSAADQSLRGQSRRWAGFSIHPFNVQSS